MHLLEQAPSKLNIITLIIISAISTNCIAEESYSFDDTFIKGKHNRADFSKYTSSELIEGLYSLDVFTNGEWKGKYDIAIKEQADGVLGVCYDEKMLTQFGISTEKLNASLAKETGYCGTLKAWNGDEQIKDQVVKSTLRLEITVPQIYEDSLYKNFVDPSRWDSGVPALNVGWAGNVYNAHYSGQGGSDSTSGYVSLDSTASAGGWSLRNRSQISWRDYHDMKMSSSQLYLQRPIPVLKSNLTAGQLAASGEFFDSVPLRGLALKSDVNMLPDVLSNFVPIINGTANSNALVTVKQDGRIIYETTVTPGPFSLTDVYPNGFGTNLEVTVKETNGSETQFIVPYNSSAKLLHPGMFKYEAVVGKPEGSYLPNKPVIYQAAAEYGFNNLFTGYAGVAGFDHYNAYLAGVGLNTALGGFALDTTTSRLKTRQLNKTGTLYRASYTRSFDATQTNLSFIGLKYSDKGYYSLGNALTVNESNLMTQRREKTNVSLTISQTLPDKWGTLYASGRLVDYWGYGKKERQYQFSYANTFGKLNYTVSVQRLQTTYQGAVKHDTQLGLNFSLPLYNSDKHASYLNSYSRYTNGKYDSTQIGVNGSLGRDAKTTYGITADMGRNRGMATNLATSTEWAKVSGSYSQGRAFRQMSMGGSGTMVASGDGIMFTPETSDTIAIIEAKGAGGAAVASSAGAKINSRGFGVMTSLRPYRVNNIEIDPKGSPDNVSFNETMKQVVPYNGSVVKVTFDTEVHDNLTFVGKFKDGKPFPFGAAVYNAQGNEIGMVGQGGVVIVRDASQPTAMLKWKNGSCTFTLPKEKSEVICD